MANKLFKYNSTCITTWKDVADLIGILLSHITNLSFSTGVFPDLLKGTSSMYLLKYLQPVINHQLNGAISIKINVLNKFQFISISLIPIQ